MVLESHQLPSTAGERDDVDLRTVGLIFRRRLKVFLIIALTIFVAGMAILPTLPDRYSATAEVLIDRRTIAVTDVESVLSGLPADSASVDTEVQSIRSPDLVRHVIQRLKLDRNPEFNAALNPPGMLQKIKSWFSTGQKKQLSVEDKVVSAVLENIDVERKGLTYVIDVTATSLTPETSAAIANALSEEYLLQQVLAKRKAANDAQSYLASRLSGLGADVEAKESAAQQLRARAGLPIADNLATYDQQMITDLSRQGIELESDLAEKRGRLAAAERARGNPDALPAVLESPTIRDLKTQRTMALSKSVDIESRYGPRHPETAKAKSQLQQIDNEISTEIARTVTSLSSDVGAAQSRLAAINAVLSARKGSAVSNARNAARVSQIDREALATRGVYEDFLKRSKETASTEGLAKPDATLMTQATVPVLPSGPNRVLLALLFAVGAVALGLVAVVIAELLDVKISSAADIERHLGLTKLASVPGVKEPAGEPALLVIEKPFSSYAEAFRTLGAHIARHRPTQPAGGGQVTVFTSALPNEGKTTVAASVALSIGRSGETVLLIDADLRRPHAAAALHVDAASIDCDRLLDGSMPLAKAVTRVPGTQVDVLAAGNKLDDVEGFRGEGFAQLLELVKQHYDFILIDTPPVLAVSDAIQISRLAESVVVVTRWRRTSRFAASAAVESLRDAGAPLAGVVLNAVNLKTQSLYAKDDALSFYSATRAYYAE